MDDMPDDDIRDTAIKIYKQYTRDPHSWSLVDLITDALMAERGRTAQPTAADSNVSDDGNSNALPFHEQPSDIQDKMSEDAAEFGGVAMEFNKPPKH